MSIMAVGACILGYADEEVDEAVIEVIKKGVSSSLKPFSVNSSFIGITISAGYIE